MEFIALIITLLVGGASFGVGFTLAEKVVGKVIDLVKSE